MLNGVLKHSVPEISVQQVVQDRSDLVFVDAREPREYAVSHIQNAVFPGTIILIQIHWRKYLKINALWSIARWVTAAKK